MPTIMKSGLSGGAAANNVNVVQSMTGIRIVRSTVVEAGNYAARSLLSRAENGPVTVATPYTLATS